MSADALLLTYAEVSVAVAGFASIVAALRQPLSPIQRNRFLIILFTSLAGVLAALVPVWLMESGLTGPSLWRISSAFSLMITFWITIVAYLSIKTIGTRGQIIINRPTTYFANVLFAIVVGTQVINLVGAPTPSFSLYFAGILVALTNVFLVFADAALLAEDES